MTTAALASRLDVLRETQKFPESVLAGFARHLSEARDDELFRMSPVRYAAAAGLAEQQGIDLFLHATRAGLLEFTWGVLCPACNGFLTTEGALRSLNKKRHCSLCDVPVEVSDESLEVAFTVSPAIRAIRFNRPHELDYRVDALRLFFSSSVKWGPGVEDTLRDRTINAGTIEAHGTTTFSFKFSDINHAVVAPELHAWAHIQPTSGGPKELVLDLLDGAALPRLNQVALGEDVKVTVKNGMPKPIMWGLMQMPGKIERTVMPYLSGKRLVTTQAFRDLFRAESIPASSGLQLKSLTLLFTDLKGSTEMYERIGDLRAYDLVRQHFGVLQDIIAARGGAMVKTIGDAIMASFPEPEPALDAAIAMNHDIRKIGAGELQLKIGMHTGSCIAVEQNERLDYFGQTVNIAARVQNVASANEIAVTEPVLGAPRAQDIVKRSGLRVSTTKESLKGVDGLVTVHHLT